MAKAKKIDGIDSDGPAQVAFAQVLRTRMEEMYAFRDSALDGSSPDGVHDMRVASRRLRTALRDFAPEMRTSHLTNVVKDIKSLARALGRVRDLDVAIIALKKARAKAPPRLSDAILQFIELRQRARDAAFLDLAEALNPRRFSRRSARFDRALNGKGVRKQARKASRGKTSPAGGPTYREVARSTILTHLKDLEDRSESFYRPNKLKPLHKARITAKRLRYALELFDQCWEHRMTSFAKKLSVTQSALGEVHDCDVWIKSLGDEATRNLRPSEADKKDALVWLMIHFVKLRTKNFRRALTQWNAWELDDLSPQLRVILMSQRIGKSLDSGTPKAKLRQARAKLEF